MKSTLRRVAASAAIAGMAFTGLAFTATPAQATPGIVHCDIPSDHLTIRYGSRGNSVREAQCILNRTGARIAVDGSFGPATRMAVINFQRSRGLVADGIVGPKTWDALHGRMATCTSYRMCPIAV